MTPLGKIIKVVLAILFSALILHFFGPTLGSGTTQVRSETSTSRP
jgi:hypothetical protein